MFAARYFARHYYPTRYFHHKATGTPTPTPAPTGTTHDGYFVHRYFSARYYANRYFPGAGFGTVTPTPTPEDDLLGGGGEKHHHHREPFSYVPAHQIYAEVRALTEKISDGIDLTKEQSAKPAFHQNLKELYSEISHIEAQKQSELNAQIIAHQEEISRLLMQRDELIRRITDDEEALVALYSVPFIH
jgi:hypothetical protein